MKMYKQCPRCGKKILINETCQCVIDNKRKKKNEYQKKYYQNNKKSVNMIKNKRWRNLRKLIIERDGGFCQRCYHKFHMFETEELQVHHIKPRVDFPELIYDENNLVTVCKQCNLQLGTRHTLDFDFKPEEISVKLQGKKEET